MTGAHAPAHDDVVDSATLYLCRQGGRWVVVIESPGVTGALRFHHDGPDAYDARFALLARAHRACPDAAIVSTDGALESADYEWRLELRGVQACPGRLGKALHDELSSEPTPAAAPGPRPATGRRCQWGPSSPFSGRPRTF